jgi:hypothetical protein
MYVENTEINFSPQPPGKSFGELPFLHLTINCTNHKSSMMSPLIRRLLPVTLFLQWETLVAKHFEAK